MPTWKFTDDYGSTYPALASSVLSLLAFSDHSVSGTDFHGTLDLSASGDALTPLGSLLGASTIAVGGTVATGGNTLSVSLRSTQDQDETFVRALAVLIPLIGNDIAQAAYVTAQTTVATTDDPDPGPQTDEFDISVVLTINDDATATLTTGVPFGEGPITITGDFAGVKIALGDVGRFMGDLGSGDKWFPAADLGPYYQGAPPLYLLSMSLSLYLTLSPLTLGLTQVTVAVGLLNLPVLGQQLYLNPLAVWVSVGPGDEQPTWGLEGSLVLCNYNAPGQTADPDFAFDLAMSVNRVIELSAQLENPSKNPVSLLLQDLLGPGTDLGIPSGLTVTAFGFEAEAEAGQGQITEFSAEVGMSGGFGLFQDVEVTIGVDYAPS